MKRISSLLISVITVWLLTGCFGEKYTVETTVNNDGSIDRKVSQIHPDTASQSVEAFGASAASGWSVERVVDTTRESGYAVVLMKHFASADEASAAALNQEMGYRLRSTYEKQSGWFYTVTRFSDIYPAGIQFEGVSPADYFDEGDFTYMAAVSLGDSVLKADTARSNNIERKVEQYLLRIFVESFVKRAGEIMVSQKIEQRWVDTISRHKSELLDLGRKGVDINESMMVSYLVDRLHVPVSHLADTLSNAVPDSIFESLFDEVDHTIVMPAEISKSNAMWVDDRVAKWKVSLGSIQELTLNVESREINYLETAITVLVFLALAGYLIRRVRPPAA